MASETNSKGEDLLVWRQTKSDQYWMAQQGIALPLESASSESSSESGEEQSDGLSTPEPYILLGVDSDTPQEMEKGRPDLVHGAAETPVMAKNLGIRGVSFLDMKISSEITYE